MAGVMRSLRERGLSRRTPGTGARLLGLVLIPTLGLLGFGGAELMNRRETAVQAEDLAGDVRRSTDALQLLVAVSAEHRAEELVVQASRFGVAPELVSELLGFELQAELAETRAAADIAPGLDLLLEGLGGRAGLRAARNVVDSAAAPDIAPLFQDLTDRARANWQAAVAELGGGASILGSGELVNALITFRLGAVLYDTSTDQLSVAAATVIPDLAAGQGPTPDLGALQGRYDQTLEYLQEFGDEHVSAYVDSVAGNGAFGELIARLPAVAGPGEGVTIDGLALVFRLGLERHANIRQLVEAIAEDTYRHALAVGVDAREGFDNLVVTLISSTIALGLLALLVARSIARPLRRLEKRAAELSNGDVDGEPLPLTGPRDTAVVAQSINDTVANLRALERKASAFVTGDLSDVDATVVPGKLSALLNSSVDELARAINERERLQRRLDYDGSHDALTGLANRREAMGSLDAMLASHEGTVAAACVDIDGFKSVNEQLGHLAGDAVLLELAGRLNEVAPSDAVVARLGGDEFLVAAPVRDGQEALDLATDVTTALSGPLDIAGTRRRIMVTAGVALSGPGEDADRLLRWADVALLEAKRGSRGRAVILDDDLRAALASQHQLEAALRSAIRDGELEVHYQPVIDLRTGRMVAVEALVRWRRDGTLIPPDLFIPTAELSDLVIDLDHAVLRQAAAQVAIWRSGRFPGLRLWVNFSARTLLSSRIMTYVGETLVRTGLPPASIGVEVTETAMLHDVETAAERLRELRELGIRTAIDDFGTGYTSISQLRRLPVDEVKIDRSFIDLMDDERELALVDMVIRIGHVLGIDVVAEGVEREDQLDTLRELGCHLVQGYLLGRPLPPSELDATKAAPSVTTATSWRSATTAAAG